MARADASGRFALRGYRPEDLVPYTELLRQTSSEEYAGLPIETLIGYLLDLDKRFVWVAEHAGAPVGFATFRPEEQTIHLLLLDVEVPFRRQGVGSLLLQEGIRLARQRLLPISCEVYIANWPARRFYERWGFQVARELPDYYSRGKGALLLVRMIVPATTSSYSRSAGPDVTTGTKS